MAVLEDISLAADRVETRLFTHDEFMQLFEMGMFEGERVELLEGRIRTMPPQQEPHYAAIHLAVRALSRIFGDGFYVRAQAPLQLGPLSDPKPDVAVVTGDYSDYLKGPPTKALLVVEVAGSSLLIDRTVKQRIYAAARVPEYWIINLAQNQIEVRRRPTRGTKGGVSAKYAQVTILKKGERITLLARPGSSVLVDDLLP